MSIKLTFHQITDAFDAGSLTRGKALFREGKANRYQASQSTPEAGYRQLQLKAEVIGSRGQIYQTDISIIEDEETAHIRSECTCPVHINCKHAVAVIFQYIQDQSQTKTHNQFDSWWQSLNAVSTLPDQREEWFSFHLFNGEEGFYSPTHLRGNQIEILRHHYTPKGKLAKPKPYRSETFINRIDRGVMPMEYRAIAELMRLCAEHFWNPSHIRLQGSAGFLLAKMMIEKGESYFQNQPQPLRWHPDSYPLELGYTSDKEQQAKLTVSIPDQHFLILSEPPILIDIKQHRAQAVDCPVSTQTLEQLLKMPFANTQQLGQLMERIEQEQMLLPQTSKTVSLPKIPGLETREIHTLPTPYLEMIQPLPNPVFHFVFKYGDFYLNPEPRQAIIQERHQGKKVIVHRNLTLEDAALSQLLPWLSAMAPEQVDPPSQATLFQLKAGSTDKAEGLDNYIALQQALPDLEAQGWLLSGFDDHQVDIVKIDHIQVHSKTHSDWFELSFNMTLGDQVMPMAPILQKLLTSYQSSDDMPDQLHFISNDQTVLQFEKSQLSPLFNSLIQLYQGRPVTDKLHLTPFDAHLVAGLADTSLEWIGAQDSLALAQKLNDFKGITATKPPKGLKATLRPYQQFGLDWLHFLHQHGFNGILADDMGLGKTVQTLSWCLTLKENGHLNQPILLIVPTSLIGNWKREAQQFTPDLNLLALHGSERFSQFEQIKSADIVLTSYPLVQRDEDLLSEFEFEYLILDEAQKIKNPRTKLYLGLQSLKSRHRLCLTGTPVENHLGELWSIFNFLMPGFLGNLKQFKAHYQKPIEIDRTPGIQSQLNQKVAPFLLRRTKHQVVKELPDKTEIIKTVEFEQDQANLYETIRLTMEDKVRQAVAEKGLAQSQITLLDALLKLRQVCCDPGLVKIDAAKQVKHSAKLELLMDLLTELLEGQHRVIIFSQFAEMLKRIASELNKHKIEYSLLTGQTHKREEAINRFKDGDVSIFLISLKAGGVGLNLTEADTVIHYDPWWNPAVENQATDRAYRIGQNKEVFVYKLVVANTIEQKILQMQANKQALQDQLYQQNQSDEAGQIHLQAQDLLNLLTPI
ncbi:hypothetical protein CYQ88_05575 [Hydrogenovibrio sp. SC-1]|uniref:DEAD/DEAH box helicase n=1 Tax=Hydrogenovibrio sp. SC-1 TaxID=2065820 RepID=UPI000C7DB067|nr:DEAD/DEAH box helicase [Hydrogenovibrio sp. SC-1]PLA74550.1 hypothetical protein CYQ88_05575 [Hydrogenovibrio sp. SC-1]